MNNAFVFTSFSVNDMKAAKHFYVDVLGFELGAPMTEYALKIVKGGQRFHLYPKPDHVPATFTVINLKIENVEQAVDDLTAAGVTFLQYDNEYIHTNTKGIASRDGLTTAWFTDPAGNIHGLLQGEG